MAATSNSLFRLFIALIAAPVGRAAKFFFPGLSAQLLLVLCLSGGPVLAQSPGGESADDVLGDGGVVRLGFRTDAAPFSYCATADECSEENPCAVKLTDKQCPAGWVEGYSVRLCEKVADHLRAQFGGTGRLKDIQYVAVSAANRFTWLDSGQIHVLCGASTVTLERLSSYRGSLYTFLSGASVIYPSGAPVKSAADLQGRDVGVLGNTTTETLLNSIKDKHGLQFDIIVLDTHADAPDRLMMDPEKSDKAIDTYFGDREILLWLAKRYELDKKYEISSIYYSLDPYALFVNPDNKALHFAVNATLAELYAKDNRSELEGLFQRSFGTSKMSDLVEVLFRIQQLPYEVPPPAAQ